MMEGVVKWFNQTKGFGFIAPTYGSPDIFVHQSEIQGEGFRSLNEGDKVEFEATQADKGPRATYVRVMQ